MTVLFIVLLAAIIGSFLNMLVYRLPKMIQQENINPLYPTRSLCPTCKHQLCTKDLVPILSYLITLGKCRYCQKNIKKHYILVEIMSIFSIILLYYNVGLSIEFIYFSLLAFALITLFWTDIETQLLPDIITLPIMWLGILYHLQFGDIHSSVIGAIAGYLSLWIVFWIFKIMHNKKGMGYGDFKLFALIGAWFGWQALHLIIFIAAILGIIFYLLIIKDRQQKFVFGPWMIVAIPLYLSITPYLPAL